MFIKSLEEISLELSKKQMKRFVVLLKAFQGHDRIDIIFKIVKKQYWRKIR